MNSFYRKIHVLLMTQTQNLCLFSIRVINKLYPIIKKFETFCVKEHQSLKPTASSQNSNLKFEKDKLQKRLGDQEELVINKMEELTKDEDLNLENLLGFINQKKLHSYLNISNIMRLNKLDFSDLYYTKDLDLMLVRKTLLEKVRL